MNEPSKTPITDAQKIEVFHADDGGSGWLYAVPYDFARDLEIKLAEATARFAEYIAQTDPFLSCGTADDPAAGRCGKCRCCLLEKVAKYRQAVAAATKESKR